MNNPVSFTDWWWWGPCWTERRPHCRRRRMERGDRGCRPRSTIRGYSATPSAANWRRRRAGRSRPDWRQTPSSRATSIYGYGPMPPPSTNCLPNNWNKKIRVIWFVERNRRVDSSMDWIFWREVRVIWLEDFHILFINITQDIQIFEREPFLFRFIHISWLTFILRDELFFSFQNNQQI